MGDALLRDWAAPSLYHYPTVDTYLEHGEDLRDRVDKENCLSSFSGIVWSRAEIFKKPTRNETTTNGRPITKIKLSNAQQSLLPAVTPDEFGSVTMGSFQERLSRQYMTKIRYDSNHLVTLLIITYITNDD